jgi:hypothetical protein
MKRTTVDKNKVGRGAGANEGGESTIAPHTNRALCAYQSSGRTSTHSNLILITPQCSSKFTVDSIDTLPIKTLIQPRPKHNTRIDRKTFLPAFVPRLVFRVDFTTDVLY